MNLLAHARACSPNPENSKLLKKLEYISRFSTIGIQIAVGKPLGDIFFQVRSLIGPVRQNNGTVFDVRSRPTHKPASQLLVTFTCA
jgi:hypothetical protein